MTYANIKNENTPTLYTNRLILRRFEANDIDDSFSLYSDDEVNKYLPWAAHKTKEQTQMYLQEVVLAEYKKNIAYCYAISLKDENCVIGFVTIHDINLESGGADLGYALKKEFWSRGIVTEACKEIIKCLKNNGFIYLTATHDVNNRASGKVMKKLGMKYCYSYEEQWQPKDITVIFRLYQLNFDGNKDRVYPFYKEKYPNHFVEKDI